MNEEITIYEKMQEKNLEEESAKLKELDVQVSRKLSSRPVQETDAVPTFDDILYCYDCSRAWRGDCPEHGPLVPMKDTLVPADIKNRLRAKQTAPDRVTALVDADGRGGGVWVQKPILGRTRFGPCEGSIVPVTDCETTHAWMIRKNGKPHHIIDASEPGLSNWMRYVNFASCYNERNLDGYQAKGQLYYRSIRRLDPHEELLVWFGDESGNQLSQDTTADADPSDGIELEHPQVELPETPALSTFRKAPAKHLPKQNKELNLQLKSTLTGFTNSYSNEGMNDLRKSPCHPSTANTDGSSYCNIQDSPLTENPKVNSSCNANSGPSVEDQLKIHRRVHTGEKPYQCEDCGKRFSRKDYVKIHRRLHTGEKAFKCDYCGKEFSRKDHLKLHKFVHTGEKPFQCEVCGRRYSEKSYLTLHNRIHTGEKPYQCEACGKRFSWKACVEIHRRLHTGEKPFQCGDCGQRFSRKDNLKEHSRIHTGEKPYQCAGCVQNFSHHKSLKTHRCAHTGEKLFHCEDKAN